MNTRNIAKILNYTYRYVTLLYKTHKFPVMKVGQEDHSRLIDILGRSDSHVSSWLDQTHRTVVWILLSQKHSHRNVVRGAYDQFIKGKLFKLYTYISFLYMKITSYL